MKIPYPTRDPIRRLELGLGFGLACLLIAGLDSPVRGAEPETDYRIPPGTPLADAPERWAQAWARGRSAFWGGRFPEAERYYGAVREALPENPDVLGELGDLYYHQFQWEAAAAAYREAVEALLKTGEPVAAARLLGIIGRLQPETAVELLERFPDRGFPVGRPSLDGAPRNTKPAPDINNLRSSQSKKNGRGGP